MNSRTRLIYIFTFVGIVLAGQQASAAEGWTADEILTYNWIYQTTISADGEWAAVTVRNLAEKDGKSVFRAQVWVVSRTEKKARQFTRGESSASSPAFSPDGQQLAFLSKRGEEAESQVWVLSMAGGEAMQFTHAKSGVNAFKWSPNGRQLAYTMGDTLSEQEEDDREAGKDMQVLDTNHKYSHLYVISASEDAKPAKRLTKGNFEVSSFDWSPDGKTIAFEHQMTPGIDDWPSSDISTVPAQGGKVKSLVTGKGYDGGPLYSPDGKWIAFISDGGSARWAGEGRINVVSAKGGKVKALAATPNEEAGGPAGWSSDGKTVYAGDTERALGKLYALPANGSDASVVTTGSDHYSNFAMTPDGAQMVFLAQTSDKPAELHTSAVAAFSPVPVTQLNGDYPLHTFGKTEVIQWTSNDGTPIEGLLTYPVGYKKGRKYPLILSVHGGPAGVYTQGFTAAMPYTPLQLWAQAGYAILRPNPRGSSGYGKEFRFANYGDWGFGDYEDLMTGVDKVIDMGVTTEEQLTVTGYSYGGFMTSWIVTQTKRFKAASIGAGVMNLASFNGTADIPSFIPDYFDGEIWERDEVYRKHSPLYQVKGVTTPTQIIHGEADVRVPLSQGTEFYVALKRLGVETEMIVYPRARHRYLTWEPEHFVDYYAQVINWFDKQLGR